MKIQPLTDNAKYELLLSLLQGKAITFNDPVGHLVVDYMPTWEQFTSEVRETKQDQKRMGGSWICLDCNDLDDYIKSIDNIMHRSIDVYDSEEDRDFVCNCSYCEIVLHVQCNCGRCKLNAFKYDFKSYTSTSHITKDTQKTIELKTLYNDGLITWEELNDRILLESRDYLLSTMKEN